jgi:flagellar hook protein FlgE
VRIGAAMDIQSNTTWNTAQTYTVGTSLKVDGYARGRFLAVRFESTGSVNWRLRRFDLEVEPFGRW